MALELYSIYVVLHHPDSSAAMITTLQSYTQTVPRPYTICVNAKSLCKELYVYVCLEWPFSGLCTRRKEIIMHQVAQSNHILEQIRRNLPFLFHHCEKDVDLGGNMTLEHNQDLQTICQM